MLVLKKEFYLLSSMKKVSKVFDKCNPKSHEIIWFTFHRVLFKLYFSFKKIFFFNKYLFTLLLIYNFNFTHFNWISQRNLERFQCQTLERLLLHKNNLRNEKITTARVAVQRETEKSCVMLSLAWRPSAAEEIKQIETKEMVEWTKRHESALCEETFDLIATKNSLLLKVKLEDEFRDAFRGAKLEIKSRFYGFDI